MLKKVVEYRASDLSGEDIPEGQHHQIRILFHPGRPTAAPIEWDISTQELKALDALTAAVVIEFTPPDAKRPRQIAISVEQLTALGDPQVIAERLVSNQPSDAPQRRPRQGGRIDYSDPQHAGTPHTGRISIGEARTVWRCLDQINARLREQGHREISRMLLLTDYAHGQDGEADG